jgi:phosphatidylinositol alpha-1,6-mannosyltransferase
MDEALSHEARQLEDYVLKFGVHPGNAVLDYLSGQRADRVIAISEHIRERLTGTYGLDEDRVVTIWHGVDTERYRPFDATHPAVSDDRFTMLTVGRLGSRKGVEFAIEGIERVDGVDLEFLIAGEGRYEGRLRELVAERGLSDRVTSLGRVEEDELPLLYSSADVFCLTSMYEGFGLVLLEVMACGTPVIATDVGGVPTVVADGEVGYLIPRSADAFAERVRRLRDDDFRMDLSAEAAQWAREMTCDAVAEQSEAVYEHVREETTTIRP